MQIRMFAKGIFNPTVPTEDKSRTRGSSRWAALNRPRRATLSFGRTLPSISTTLMPWTWRTCVVMVNPLCSASSCNLTYPYD